MNYLWQSIERNLEVLNDSKVFQVLLFRRKYRAFSKFHSPLKTVSLKCSLNICSKAVLKNFAKDTGKHLCVSLQVKPWHSQMKTDWPWCSPVYLEMTASNNYAKTFLDFFSLLQVCLGKVDLRAYPNNSLCLQNGGTRIKGLNPLSAKLTKWPNTLKQFVGNLPMNCLSVFGHFEGLALKWLKHLLQDFWSVYDHNLDARSFTIKTLSWLIVLFNTPSKERSQIVV